MVVREKTKECAEQSSGFWKVKLGRDNDKEIIETIRSVTALPIACRRRIRAGKTNIMRVDMIFTG